MSLHAILLILHIAFAAVWFGAAMGVPASLRRAMRQQPSQLIYAANEAWRRAHIAWTGGVLTLVTGLALIFKLGGFSVVTPRLHAAMGLVLLLLGVGLGVYRPALARLRKGEGDEAAQRGRVVRLSACEGITHLGWVVTLVLMLWGR